MSGGVTNGDRTTTMLALRFIILVHFHTGSPLNFRQPRNPERPLRCDFGRTCFVATRLDFAALPWSAASFSGLHHEQVISRFSQSFEPPFSSAMTCSTIHVSDGRRIRVHRWHFPCRSKNNFARFCGDKVWRFVWCQGVFVMIFDLAFGAINMKISVEVSTVLAAMLHTHL